MTTTRVAVKGILFLVAYGTVSHSLSAAPIQKIAKLKSRRESLGWLATSLITPVVGTSPAIAVEQERKGSAFVTNAVGRSEYTNSITASRDTNISPQEAYDVILERIPRASTNNNNAIALDLGAGAGLSTSVLYNNLGYNTIDAVDWSRDAWDENVVQVPDSVHFYQSADAGFFRKYLPDQRSYDVIVYNFAINPSKAVQVARDHLSTTGMLLAPVNDKADYWYKQSYWVVNQAGEVVYKSRPEVGAWSVQFQPDVTSDTCTGIWCGGFNGFKQK